MFLTLLAMLLATGYASAPECAFDGRGYTEASHKTAESKLWIRASSGSISRVHVSLSEASKPTSFPQECRLSPDCFFWTFYNNSYMCWLLGESATLMDQPDPKATSGAKLCRSGRVKPGEVINIPTKASHLDEALEAIHKSAEEAFKKLDVDRSALVKPQQLVEAPRRQDQAQHSASAQGPFGLGRGHDLQWLKHRTCDQLSTKAAHRSVHVAVMPIVQIHLPKNCADEATLERIRVACRQHVLDTLSADRAHHDYVTVVEVLGKMGDGVPLVKVDQRPGREKWRKEQFSQRIAKTIADELTLGLVWSILVMIVSGAIVVGGVSAMWILTQDATREVHLTPEQEAIVDGVPMEFQRVKMPVITGCPF
eukprot:g6459.t1